MAYAGLCPKCGGELELGYGLAGGEEVGPYVFCTACNYFEKFDDPERDNPPENQKDNP